MQVCANCGHDNEPEITHCRTCGVELGRTTDPDAHPDEVVDGTSSTERAQGGEKA
ncbi:MAG: hypothetical protein ACRDUY_06770 [Nitriliruptorales bacterium]